MINLKALERAIQIMGGQKVLAEAIGVRVSTVSNWKINDHIPAERCLAIERVTGVTRHELRPDLWEAPFIRIPRRTVSDIQGAEQQKNDPAQL